MWKLHIFTVANTSPDIRTEIVLLIKNLVLLHTL